MDATIDRRRGTDSVDDSSRGVAVHLLFGSRRRNSRRAVQLELLPLRRPRHLQHRQAARHPPPPCAAHIPRVLHDRCRRCAVVARGSVYLSLSRSPTPLLLSLPIAVSRAIFCQMQPAGAAFVISSQQHLLHMQPALGAAVLAGASRPGGVEQSACLDPAAHRRVVKPVAAARASPT